MTVGFGLFLQVDCCKKLEMLVLDNTQPTNHSLNSDFSCVLVLVSTCSPNTDMYIVLNIRVTNLYTILIKLIYKPMNCELRMKRTLLVFEIEFHVLWFFPYSFQKLKPVILLTQRKNGRWLTTSSRRCSCMVCHIGTWLNYPDDI